MCITSLVYFFWFPIALWSSSALVQTPDSKTLLTSQTLEISCEANTLSKTSIIYWLRQRGGSKDKHFEFLVSWNPSKGNAVYGEGVQKEHITVFSHLSRSNLNLTRLKPEDSGTYFCMMIGSPQLIFGKGTELRVGKNASSAMKEPASMCTHAHTHTHSASL